MKLLYDFFPIVLFFLAYQLAGIYTATVVAIVASIVQVVHARLRNGQFETMHLVSLGLIVSLGTLTLVLRDKAFIMWKPTLINGLFAAVFLATSFVGEKPLIKRMLGSQLELPAPVWKNLNFLWVGFFLFSAAVNVLFVKHFQTAENALINAVPNLSAGALADLDCERDFADDAQALCQTAKDREQLWVQFKLFGNLGLTFIFILLQGWYLYRFLPHEQDTEESSP
ncbi:MAG TPA: septation protein A [Gammaproteobacteria bacterium]|jgi:intracellular septation protein|nr:septation protein A [Gammaproteobacteria bacterium]